MIGLDNQAEVFELVYFGKIGLFAAVLNGDLMMYGKFGSGNRIAVFVPGQNDADEPGSTDAGRLSVGYRISGAGFVSRTSKPPVTPYCSMWRMSVSV